MALDDYEVEVWAVVGIHASLDMVKLLLARGMAVKGRGLLIPTADRGDWAAVRLFLGHGGKTGTRIWRRWRRMGRMMGESWII